VINQVHQAARRKGAPYFIDSDAADQPGQAATYKDDSDADQEHRLGFKDKYLSWLCRQPPVSDSLKTPIRRVDTYLVDRDSGATSAPCDQSFHEQETIFVDIERRTAWLAPATRTRSELGRAVFEMLGTTWSPFRRPGREPDRSDLAKVFGRPRTAVGPSPARPSTARRDIAISCRTCPR